MGKFGLTTTAIEAVVFGLLSPFTTKFMTIFGVSVVEDLNKVFPVKKTQKIFYVNYS